MGSGGRGRAVGLIEVADRVVVDSRMKEKYEYMIQLETLLGTFKCEV